MTYLFIRSVSVNHSGTYICKGPNNKRKSVDIHVQGKWDTFFRVFLQIAANEFLLLLSLFQPICIIFY